MRNVNRSAPPPDFVVKEMGDFVEKYVVALAFIPREDPRDPPGDHWGTGWLVEGSSGPILATCEHVATEQSQGQLGYSCYGGEQGISVGSQFSLHPFPLDFAKADITKTFKRLEHAGECSNINHYAVSHCPVEDEYLYAYGFPGADVQVGFGQHEIRGMGVFLREVDFDPVNFSQTPVPVKGTHICCAWNPEMASPLVGTTGNLSLPDGMSGSPLWTTTYIEVSQ
ncbi:hypothetical protein ACOZB2_28455, partial [Pantoea endophytica]